MLDGKFLVSNAEAIEALRELTDKEGIFAGVSQWRGARRGQARGASRWSTAPSWRLLADGGWKYLSEDIWTRDLEADADVVDNLNLW